MEQINDIFKSKIHYSSVVAFIVSLLCISIINCKLLFIHLNWLTFQITIFCSHTYLENTLMIFKIKSNQDYQFNENTKLLKINKKNDLIPSSFPLSHVIESK